ncbi:MAG TPA: lanthionine synthetase C family protein [Chloroflexia bacterium]|jgi:lantibiotic modifying enzyme
MTDIQVRSWRTVLDNEQARAAASIAHEIATRLRDPDRVASAAATALQQTAFPQTHYWQPYKVSQGNAGLAVLFAQCDACFPGEGWDAAGHRHIVLAARDAEQSVHLSPGAFSGLSGLAFAVWQLSRGGSRYRNLIESLEQTLLPQTLTLVRDLDDWRRDVTVSEFDAISGLSGIAAYLLCRREVPDVAATLQALVESLVVMTAEDAGIPRWYTPGHLMWDESTRKAYPHGNLNCGLAHGIPGPLVVLALAQLSGVKVPGLGEAIDRVATWLSQSRCDDEWGINWPTAVALEGVETPGGMTLLRATPPAQAPWGPGRAAWCYGSPGVARALWLAGEALDDTRFRALAISAMEAVYRRPIAARSIDSPTFCHGVAGLMQITLRFANDTGLPLFTEAAQALAGQLLGLYDPDSLLGYQDIEYQGRRVDQPGLLTGAPGVALALLAAGMNVQPTWDRLFLLS